MAGSPGSDNWADAPLIESIPFVSDPTDNTTFTRTAAEQDIYGQQTAWWKWVPTVSETITADTVGTTVAVGNTTLDTRLSLWREETPGSATSPVDGTLVVEFNDDIEPTIGNGENGGWLSRLTADVEAGVTYWFDVGSFNEGLNQNYVLRVFRPADGPPTGDGGGDDGGGGGNDGGGDPTPSTPVQVAGHQSVIVFATAPGYTTQHIVLEVGVSTPLAPNEELPTEVELIIAGAQPGEVVTLVATNTAYDNDPDAVEVDLGTATVDSEGNLGPFSVLLTEEVAALPGFIGEPFYIKATGVNGYGYTALTYLGTDVSTVGSTNPGIDAAPVHVANSDGHWVLQDLKPGGLGSWIMDIGPTSMTPPHLAKVVNVQHTTDPEAGQFHISESNLDSPDWTLTGFCPNRAFYDRLVAYSELKRRFYVIDHRGRAWKVAAQNLQLTPRNRKTLVLPGQVGTWEDWMNDYQLTLAIYGQEFVIP